MLPTELAASAALVVAWKAIERIPSWELCWIIFKGAAPSRTRGKKVDPKGTASRRDWCTIVISKKLGISGRAWPKGRQRWKKPIKTWTKICNFCNLGSKNWNRGYVSIRLLIIIRSTLDRIWKRKPRQTMLIWAPISQLTILKSTSWPSKELPCNKS